MGTQPLDPEILEEIRSKAESRAASRAASEVKEEPAEIKESRSSTKTSRTASLVKVAKLVKMQKDKNGSFGFTVTSHETENKIIVTDIESNGVAQEAGVEKGDVVLAVDGEKVEDLKLTSVVKLI